MMSFRTDLLPTVDLIRNKRGPGAGNFDIQTVKVDIVQRVWSGGRRGLGTVTETTLANLPQKIKVRVLTTKEVAQSGGTYQMQDLRVGPITPAYTGGGFTPQQLKPAGADGTEIIYKLTGTIAGDYMLVEIRTDKAFSYYLVVRRTRSTP